MSPDRRLDQWMREEADVAAPDRLLEDVFARTEVAGQVRQGWRGRIESVGRRRAGGAVAAWRRSVVGIAALVVVGLAGISIGARLGTTPSGSSATASPSATSPSAGASSAAMPSVAATRDLVVVGSHQTCARRGSLVVLPPTAANRASAWVTCGADAEEIVIGSDVVTPRSGLGTVATDGVTEWAIRADSVVLLNRDRSVARTVRIGTPAAVAVAGSKVWVLDALTGRLVAIGPDRIEWSVTPAPSGRVVAIVFAAGSLWALDQTAAAVLRIDPSDGRLVGTIPVAATPTALVAAANALYAASPVSGTITRIDPASGTAVTLVPDLGPDGHIDALSGSADGLLVGSRASVVRLDPATGAVLGTAVGSEYVAAVGLSGSTALVLTEVGTLLEATAP